MAGIGSGVLTLLDWAKRLDPDGSTAQVAEILSQSNPILTDAIWQEGNLPTGHRVTQRTGLPSVYWRLLNQGTPTSKSTTAQVTETIGSLVAWSEVDCELAELNGNVNQFRLSEATAFLEAMSQELAQTVFYGNAAISPQEPTGLSIRYSDTTAGNGQNIVLSNASSGTDNTSIWFITWSPQTVFMAFPKGSRAGIDHQDLGKVTVETTEGVAGSRMRAYQDHFIWKAGLVVKDWRHISCVRNIDTDTFNHGTPANRPQLVEEMIRATHRLQNPSAGRTVCYMNRSSFQRLDLDRLENAGVAGLSYADVDGKMTPMFRQFPIRITDAITNSEETYA